jgi:hypothetical protein
MMKLPNKGSSGHNLLVELARSSGTFYQVCERLKIDIENERTERNTRHLFDTLLGAGHVRLVGVIYSITTAARTGIAPAAPFVGQVAGPKYRGTPNPMPVTIARRAAGARA